MSNNRVLPAIILLCLPALAFSQPNAETTLSGQYINQTREMERTVVNVFADNDDWNGSGRITIPSGYEVLWAEPVIYSQDNGQFSITSIQQPILIQLKYQSDRSLESAFEHLLNTLEDVNAQTQLRFLLAAINIGTVVDYTTRAEIQWVAHAEGNLFGDDGHIHAGIRYELARRPSTRDYQEILLDLAQLSSESTAEDIQRISERLNGVIERN